MGSGNVVSPQVLPVVQSFANAASGVGGVNSSLATNATEAESGGDIDTSGDDGRLAGNLVDVPADAVVQPFGNAVALLGSKSAAAGLNETQGEVGGTSTSSGQLTSLSGIDSTTPAGVDLPIYDVPFEVIAKAIAESADMSTIESGEGDGQLTLPVTGALAPTELPTIMPTPQRSMPAGPAEGVFSEGVFSGVLTGVAQEPGEYHILPAPYPVIGRSGPAEAVGGVIGDVVAGDLVGKLGNDFGGRLVHGLGEGEGAATAQQIAGGVGAKQPLSGVDVNVNGVPVGGSQGRDLPSTPRLPGLPGLPGVDDLFKPLSGITIGGRGIARDHGNDLPVDVPALGELDGATSLLPDLPTPTDLTDITAVIPVVPAVNDMSDLTTQLPALPGTESLPGAESLPLDRSLLPSGETPSLAETADLTGGGLLPALPGTTSRSGLPAVPGAEYLTGGLLPALPGTTSRSDLPAVPAEELSELTTEIPPVHATSDLSDVRALIPTLPASELAETTSQLPRVPGNVTGSRSGGLVPAAELSEVTARIPRVPGNGRSNVPGVRELLPTLPAAQLAEITSQIPQVPGNVTGSRSGLPGLPGLPGDLTEITAVLPVVPGTQGRDLPVGQQLDESSLDSTRAALANLFTTHPIN
jgi:hypothetical protein